MRRCSNEIRKTFRCNVKLFVFRKYTRVIEEYSTFSVALRYQFGNKVLADLFLRQRHNFLGIHVPERITIYGVNAKDNMGKLSETITLSRKMMKLFVGYFRAQPHKILGDKDTSG